MSNTYKSLDDEIMSNPELREALDKGIDDLEAGRLYSRDEARRMIRQQTEERLNARAV